VPGRLNIEEGNLEGGTKWLVSPPNLLKREASQYLQQEEKNQLASHPNSFMHCIPACLCPLGSPSKAKANAWDEVLICRTTKDDRMPSRLHDLPSY
jgi:hypothetical protein